MKKQLAIVVTAILCVTVAHAQWGKKIKGNGNVISIERQTGTYSGISIDGFYEIELVEGPEGKLDLRGEENILENIETEVKGNMLIVKRKNNLNLIPSKDKDVFITIPVDKIDKIRLSGSGKFTGKKELKADDLDIRVSGSRNIDLTIDVENISVAISGSSNIKLKGMTNRIKVRSSGSSNIQAYDLVADSADFELSGSSNVEVTVNETLSSRVSGSGHIRYHGNPQQINNQISGSGSVSKK